MKISRGLAVLFLLSGISLAQISRVHSDIAFKADGRPAGGALVRVCTAAATGSPSCSPLASIFTDATLTIPKANPFTADSNGNYTYYAAPAYYKEQVNVSNAITTNLVRLVDPDVDDLLILKADLVAGKVPPSQMATGDVTNSSLCPHGGVGAFAMAACGSLGGGDAVTIQTNSVASGAAANKGEGYFYNGTALTLRKGGHDNHADDWGCDKTGATSATTCLQSMLDTVSTSTGQSVKLPSGTYLIGAGTELHIRREMTIDGSGGGADTPATTIKLGPGANIVFDKSTYSSDGGRGDWNVFRSIAVIGSKLSCTATSGSGVLASCSGNPSTALSLSANDYLVGTGTSSALWRLWFPHGTQVASTTSNSITLAGGVTSLYTGAVTVMKSGFVNGTGTTSNASQTITGVATACALWHPADPIQGPGISYPNFVTGCNTGASTITLFTAAGAGFGAGNLTKGPLANVAVHAGSVVIEDVAIIDCAGFCYDNNGSVSYTPATIADGNYINRLRVVRSGDALVHFQGADSNTATTIGVQGTSGANGCIYDQSFLGNTHIGAQCAGGDGYPYYTTGAGATTTFLGPYIEGGQKAPKYAALTLVLNGASQSLGAGGGNNGNIISTDGRMSPSFYTKNMQGVLSTATCTNGSPTLTSVVSIAQWHVGDAINADCLPSTTLVSASDGVSVLTANKNAVASGDLIPITQTVTRLLLGGNNGNSVLGFGYSAANATFFDYQLDFDDPAYRVAGTYEPGFFMYRYRGTSHSIGFPTDQATNFDDQVTSPGTTAPIKFGNGIRVGNTSNAPAIKANASASAPTSGEWQNGSLGLSTTNGLWQQRNAGKSTTGTADTTSGSATIANQDANFLAKCAPNDRVSGTGIQAATYLVDQNTLSKAATATNTGTTVTCRRIAKAHVTTTCTIATGTNTCTLASTISGWAINDTIQAASGIPAGTFLTVAPSGTTFTLSQNATANGVVTVYDAQWGTGIFSSIAGLTTLTDLTVTGTCTGCGSGITTIRDEGTPLTLRSSVSFEGAGVTCADDGGNTRTQCTIPGTAGGLPDPVANGIIAETGAGTTAARTLTAGSSKITITNPQGIAGNPTFDVAEAQLTAANLILGVSTTNSVTLTNKTIDAEGTGNVITIPVWIVLPAAGCNNTTPAPSFDLPTSGAAVADCIGAANTTGVLDFADGSTTAATAHFTTPADWDTATNLDITVYYGGDTASTNTLRWQVSTACVADGQDTLAPSYNAASAANTAGPATIGFRKSSAFTNVAKTNCAAGETMWLKVERVGANGGDTYTGVGQLLELGILLRRTM